MADPAQQRGFTSQTSSITLPPNKRPRLSPGAPGSPFGSSYPSSPLVNYSTPDYSQMGPYSSFNSPQPVQQPQPTTPSYDANARPAPGTMGPPEKPKADKGTDINDLSDLVTAAGVDLREEENYLAATYRNQHATQISTASTSFNTSQGSSNTISPDSSFALWTQSPTGPQYNHAGTPTLPLTQPAVPIQTYEESIRARHKDAARKQSELRAKHLNDPFLRGNSVRERMQKWTFDGQVRFKDSAETTEVQRRDLESSVSGRSLKLGDGSALVAAKVSTVAQDAALSDILSLISLAAQERLRGVLEDSYAAGRARRYGSTGVVPLEFVDIAIGNGAPEKTTAKAESLTGTAWDAMPDSAISPMTVLPLKRSREENVEIPGRLPTPPAEPQAVFQPTIRFQARLPPTIHRKGKQDLERERARLATRKKRLEEKERRERQGSQGAAESPAANSPSASTPRSTIAKPAVPEKLTKKERERQAKAGQTDELYHKQANATASMALGKSKYAWMNTGAPAAAAPAIGTGAGYHARLSGAGQAARRPDSTSGAPAGEAGLVSKDSYKKIGLLKEGPGVEMRDLVNVLEREGKENKSILKGLIHLEAKD